MEGLDGWRRVSQKARWRLDRLKEKTTTSAALQAEKPRLTKGLTQESSQRASQPKNQPVREPVSQPGREPVRESAS